MTGTATDRLRAYAQSLRESARPIGVVADEIDQLVDAINADERPAPIAPPAPNDHQAPPEAPARKPRQRVKGKTKRASRKR